MQHQPWKWWIASLILSCFAPSLSAQTCDSLPGLAYGSYVDRYGQTQDLLLDLLLPSSSSAPVVIFLHGGGWKSGSRAPVPSRVSDLCARGYAVASIDYRLTGTAVWPAQIQDVRGAVRWLRAHAFVYGLDPDRFAAWGESAGAHLAALLGTSGGVSTITIGNSTVELEGTTGGFPGESSRVQAVVDWYGATDFLQMHFYPTTMNHDAASSDESRLIGGPIQDNPDRTATANPVTYVTPDDPPFLLMHGTVDKTNPFNQSELLLDALTASGVAVELWPVQNAGHGGAPFNATSVVQKVYAFLDAALAETSGAGSAAAEALVLQSTAGGALVDPSRPFVSVSATDRDASEPGTNRGAFTVWRTGSTAEPLTVQVTAGGSADGISDYVLDPTTVTFDTGIDHVVVSVEPLDDFFTEETESVTLSVEPDPAISVGPYIGSRVLLADDDDPGLPVLLSLSVSPATVTGGAPATATVTLDRAAPAGGSVVSLSTSNSSAATVPASVTVPAGSAVATFTVTSKPVAATVSFFVAATYRGVGRTAPLTIEAPVLSGLTLTPATVAGGCGTSTGKVTLSGKAPGGGLVVTLADDVPAAAVPASVAVPAGASSATFPIPTTTVTASQSGTVTASLGGAARSASLTVRPIGLQSLALSPNPVVGPGSATGTVTLECDAPAGGLAVTLSSTATAVAWPDVPSLTIPAGGRTASFPVSTADVSAVKTATIRATANGTSKSVTLTVQP